MRSAAAEALAVAGTSCTTAFSALLLKKARLQTVPGTEAILARQRRWTNNCYENSYCPSWADLTASQATRPRYCRPFPPKNCEIR